MKLTKIKPKMTFEEAYPKIIKNFIPLYEMYDNTIKELDLITKEKYKNGKDNVIFENFHVLYIGQKMVFQMCEEHSKFIYAIRDVVAEYGNAIEKLSEHIETLAKESTNKELTNRILREHVNLKDNLTKIESKIDDSRMEIEDWDKWRDNLTKNMPKKDGDEKNG